MATDPTTILTNLLTATSQFGRDYAQGQQVNDQHFAAQQDAAQNNLIMQAETAKSAQEAQYQQRVQSMIDSGGKPADIYNLAIAYPDKAKALKDVVDMKRDDEKQSDLSTFGSVSSALDANRPDLARRTIQDRRDAVVRTGGDTGHLDQMLSALDSRDPNSINLVKSLSRAEIFAHAGADKFAELYGINKDKPYTLSGDDVRYDGNNNVVARGPGKTEAPHFYTLKDANGVDHEFVYQSGALPAGATLSQGSSASAGAPPSGRTTGGWTPRQRNGGDNSDAAVDNKIAGVAKALGVDPSADLSGVSPMQIAKALAYGEGGAGSLADKNNNPTNLRNPDGSYKQFASKDASLAAAAGLVARKLKAGQTNVRTLIEGLPVGGGAAGSQSASVGLPGSRQLDGTPFATAASGNVPGNPDLTGPAYINDLKRSNPGLGNRVQAILDTRAPYPTSNQRSPAGQALQNAVNQADPTFDAAAWKRRSDTIAAYAPAGKVGQAVLSGKTLINHLYDMALASEKLPDHSTAVQNRISNWFSSATNDPALISYNEGRKFLSTELPKFLAGKAPAEGEIKQNYDSYDPAKGASGIRTALKNDLDYIAGRFGPLVDTYKDQTGKDFDIDRAVPGGQVTAKIAALENWAAGGKLVAPTKALGGHPPAPASKTAPTPSAVAYLRSNPALAQQFDQKYGLGSAARILGR